MARYDSSRKIERNKLVAKYRLEHPDFSLNEIGAVFGISGKRVWQILKKAEEKTIERDKV